MYTKRRQRRRRLTIYVGLLLACASCAPAVSPPAAPSPDSARHPSSAAVRQQNTPHPGTTASSAPEPLTTSAAQRTCAAFATVLLTLDATTGTDPARARTEAARRWGTPGLAAHLTGSGQDPEWDQLAQHRGRVSVATSPVQDDPPPTTPEGTAAAVLAHRTGTTPEGTRALSPLVVYCALRHIPPTPGWRVVDLRLSDTDDTANAPPALPPPPR